MLLHACEQLYELPKWIPPDTHYLISRMLIVDPIKRITVPEILAHPWTRCGMKTYMIDTTLQAAPGMVGTVSHLLQTMKQEVIVSGLGAINMDIVDQLASQLNVVRTQWNVSASNQFLNGCCTPQDPRAVMEALAVPADNAVKVAYMIMVDHQRAGRESQCRYCLPLVQFFICPRRSDACGPKT
jgi:carbon catabolite-derepressing protein kinase